MQKPLQFVMPHSYQFMRMMHDRINPLLDLLKRRDYLCWPGNKRTLTFTFCCPVEIQLCRGSKYLFYAGINSDVHLNLLKSELETNTAGDLFMCHQRRNSLQYQSWTSLEETGRDSDGGTDSLYSFSD